MKTRQRLQKILVEKRANNLTEKEGGYLSTGRER
jgi:hypothetical protein